MKRDRGKSAFTLIELLIVIAIIAILALIAIPNFLEAQIRSKVSKCHADMRSLAVAIESYFVDYNEYPIMPRQNVSSSLSDGEAECQMLSEPKTYSNCLWSYDRDTDSVTNRTRNRAICMTTPIAYITDFPEDPFHDTSYNFGDSHHVISYFYCNFLGAARRRAMGSLPDCDPAFIAYTGYEPVAPVVAPQPMYLNGHRDAGGALIYNTGNLYHLNWFMCSIGPKKHSITGQLTTVLYGESRHLRAVGGEVYVYDPSNGTTSRGRIFRSHVSIH